MFFKSVYFNILLKVEEERTSSTEYCVSKVFMSGLMKMLYIHENSWARHCKQCDSKLEQTEVSIFTFSMKIFGHQKTTTTKKNHKLSLLAFLMSLLQRIKVLACEQTVGYRSVHQASHFLTNPVQPYLAVGRMQFLSTVCSVMAGTSSVLLSKVQECLSLKVDGP